MKQWLKILIIACVLLAACSVKAEDRPALPRTPEEADSEEKAYREALQAWYAEFLNIKVFDIRNTGVSFEGSFRGGLDRNELTDYLRLKIKNNFANINIEEPDINKYTEKQIGVIRLRIWINSDHDSAAVHLWWKFYDRIKLKGVSLEGEGVSVFHSLIPYSLWEDEILGVISQDDISSFIKNNIDEMIEELAILFYKVRGEL